MSEEDAALITELRAKAHASTRHKVRYRTPTPVKEHVCWRAADRLEGLTAERAEMLANLADPKAVHLNMLRGGIAKPAVADILHVYQGALSVPREAVAKLIDPVAFERIENGGYRFARMQTREDALAKADQIIAAFRQAGR